MTTQTTQIPGPPTQETNAKRLSSSVAHLDVLLLATLGLGLASLIATFRRIRAYPRKSVAVLSLLASTIALIRRLGRRSGVTNEEIRETVPGDDLIPDAVYVSNRALTVRASVDEVWPWIVQMGYHRGGWYTSRRLDKLIWRIDNPSAEHIVREYQNVATGDIIPDGPPSTAYFTVADIKRNQHIVYLDATGSHVPGVRFSWAFVVKPIDDRTTRLQVRWRAIYPSNYLMKALVPFMIGPADYVMMLQVMRGIKRRAESV